jgi:ankyrin repeat protein
MNTNVTVLLSLLTTLFCLAAQEAVVSSRSVPDLHQCVNTNAIGRLSSLLMSPDVNCNVQDEQGRTALHCAVLRNSLQAASGLLQAGIAIDLPDLRGSTALHYAAAKGNTALVTLLINNGATIHCQNKKGLTPLHCAAREGKHETVSVILAKKANFHMTPAKGESLIMSALHHYSPEHRKTVEIFISELLRELSNRAPAVAIDEEICHKLLMTAAQRGHCGYIELLLSRNIGTYSQVVDDRELYTKLVTLLHKKHDSDPAGNDINKSRKALHFACSDDYLELVAVIVTKYPSIINEKETNSGLTVLHQAIKDNKLDLITRLIRLGANPTISCIDYGTALHYASAGGYYDAVTILLQAERLQINNINKAYQGKTALHYAVECGSTPIVKALLNAGAEIKEVSVGESISSTNNGVRFGIYRNETPLHCAVRKDDLEITSLLITAYKGDLSSVIDKMTSDNQTALWIAYKNNNYQICSLLLKEGADVNATISNNETLLHDAAKNGFLPFVKLFIVHNVDLNKTIRGTLRTALHIAAAHDHEQIVSALLDAGVDATLKDKSEKIALQLAGDKAKKILEKHLQQHH